MKRAHSPVSDEHQHEGDDVAARLAVSVAQQAQAAHAQAQAQAERDHHQAADDSPSSSSGTAVYNPPTDPALLASNHPFVNYGLNLPKPSGSHDHTEGDVVVDSPGIGLEADGSSGGLLGGHDHGGGGMSPDGTEDGGDKKKRKIKPSAPRTSRACLTCRKQKMRCEGAEDPPCKRCRAGNQECHFERRSDFVLNPQDSAWQTRIEHRLTTLTATVEAILVALDSRGVRVNLAPPPPAQLHLPHPVAVQVQPHVPAAQQAAPSLPLPAHMTQATTSGARPEDGEEGFADLVTNSSGGWTED